MNARKAYLILLVALAALLVAVLTQPEGAAQAGVPTNITFDHDDCLQGVVCGIRMNAQDPGDTLTWELLDGPDEMTIHGPSGVLTWAPTKDQADTGSHTVKVRVSDQAGNKSERQFTVKAYRLVQTDHFRLYWWEPDHNVTEAYAQKMGAEFENSWNKELNTFGYKQPPNTAAQRMRVWIHSLPDAWGATYPATGTQPAWFEMTINMADDRLQSTAAHEFFHAIQHGYRRGVKWFNEATTTWMSHEVYPDVHLFVERIQNANSIINKPNSFMTTTFDYGGVVYPMALGELHGSDTVRKIWEQLAADPDYIKGTITTLGGEAAWRTFWEDFAHRNYDTRLYKEGDKFGVYAARGMVRSKLNYHYIFDFTKPYPPVLHLGDKIESATYPIAQSKLTGLSANYTVWEVPAELKHHNTRNSEMFLYFDGDDAVPWSVTAYGILNNGQVTTDTIRLLDPNANNATRTGSAKLAVGGSGAADYKAVVIIAANADTRNVARTFKLGGVIVPLLKESYPPNADNGTTSTVKNLGPQADPNNQGPDEDNIYKNGDTIEVEVDVSDKVHIGGGNPIPRNARSLRADFTAIDSNATPLALLEAEQLDAAQLAQLEEITTTTTATYTYKIKYVISASNTLDGKRVENLPLKLEVQDLSLQDAAYTFKDSTFKVIVDNEPPKVSQVIVTQGGKTIYDSQAGVSEWAKAGQVQVKIVFNEPMMTHLANATAVDPAVSFGLAAPYSTMVVSRSTGWATSVKKNDTWIGTAAIPEGQALKFDGPNTLSIDGRDQAGNWLGGPRAAGQPASQLLAPVPNTTHKFKVDTTPPEVFSKPREPEGDPECPSLKVYAKAWDVLQGAVVPERVSGLKQVAYRVLPGGTWVIVNDPANPYAWLPTTIPPKQTVTLQLYAEDKAGNKLVYRVVTPGRAAVLLGEQAYRPGGPEAPAADPTGYISEVIENNFPGCDKPDDNLSAASLAAPAASAQVGGAAARPVAAQVAVLNNGFTPMTQAYIEAFGEPTVIVETDFDPAIAAQYPLLVIPSGGLYGLGTSASFKARLESYLNNGGSLLVFDQQHGYEYGILPGGLGGYGWVEDNSCYQASLYMSDYHQVLSGQYTNPINAHVDGFLTSYPPGALVPLNRSQNGFAGLVLYPYGQGWVAATTIYDDYGRYNYQGMVDSQALIRDLVSWALAPATLPEYKPDTAINLPVPLENHAAAAAGQAVLRLLNPEREQVYSTTVPVSLPPGGQQVVTLTTTVSFPKGIWWVDYELLDAGGAQLQARARATRFVISDPPANAGPNKQLSLSITAPNESFVPGATGRFTFHVFNFTAQAKDVLVKYLFPHHTWETGQNYGDWGGRELTFTLSVPPAVLGAGQTPLKPGEATHVVEAVMKTNDRLFGYVYNNDSRMDENYFKIWRANPAVDAGLTLDQAVYRNGQAGSAQLVLSDSSGAGYDVTVEWTGRDAQNAVFFQKSQTTTLEASQTVTLTTGFIVTGTHSGRGVIEALVKAASGATLGNAAAAFEVPASPLSFALLLPEVLEPSKASSVRVRVENADPAQGVDGVTLSGQLAGPQGAALDLGSQSFDIGAGQALTRTFNFTVPPAGLGEWHFQFRASDPFITRLMDETRYSRLALSGALGQAAYIVRRPLALQARLSNDGIFVENVTLAASGEGGMLPVLELAPQGTLLAPGQGFTQTFNLAIPGDMPAGAHSLWLTATQASGASLSQQVIFMVQDSELGVSARPASLAAGSPFSLTLVNRGGADAAATYTLTLRDAAGKARYTLANPTAPVRAQGSLAVSETLPADLASGAYWLYLDLLDSTNGAAQHYMWKLDLAGLGVQMSNWTDNLAYLETDPISATAAVTRTGGAFSGGLLTMQVVGPRTPRPPAAAAARPSLPPVSAPAFPSAQDREGGRPAAYQPPRASLAGSRVLLVEDRNPWNLTSVQQVLAANEITYDLVMSDALPTVDLYAYEMVIFPSDQTTAFNAVVNANMARLEAYARQGGKLIIHTATFSNDEPHIQGPGGVTVEDGHTNYYNFTALPDHPLAAGVSELVYGNYASHNVLGNLPAGAEVIFTVGEEPGGQPTLAVYPLGDGMVILSGQTPEHAYASGYQEKAVLQNEITWLYSYATAQVYWEWQTEYPPSGLAPESTIITPVVPLTATGKLYLRSWVDSARGQRLGQAAYAPFYRSASQVLLTVEADKAFYASAEAMQVSGLLKNGRAGVTLTSRITVTLDGQVVHTAGPVSLLPGQSYPYTFNTTAPAQAGSARLAATADDVAGTLVVSDTVQVVQPTVKAALGVPQVAGQAPFTATLSLQNTSQVPAVFTYTLYASPGGPAPLWSGTASLPVGASSLLEKALRISASTSYRLELRGGVSQTLSAATTFGEAARTIFSPPVGAGAGVIPIAYRFENSGQLDTSFTTWVTLTQSAGPVVQTGAIPVYLGAPGGVFSGTWPVSLTAGVYNLAYSSLFGSGLAMFNVLGLDQAHARAVVGAPQDDRLPVDVTVFNTGANDLYGSLGLEIAPLDGAARLPQGAAAWASLSLPFTLPHAVDGSRTAALGSGWNTTGMVFDSSYRSARTQLLYLGSEIAASGRLTRLALNLSYLNPNAQERQYHDLTIRMKHTAATNWEGYQAYADMSGAATVFGPADVVLPGAAGLYWFDLLPFEYDAAQNLIVEFTWGLNDYTTYDLNYVSTTYMPFTAALHGYSDQAVPPPFGYSSYSRPNLSLSIERLEPSQQALHFAPNLAAARPGVQQAVMRAFNNQGRLLNTDVFTFMLQGPSFHIYRLPAPTPQFNAGENALLELGVENRGDLAGEAGLSLNLGDIFSQTNRHYLRSGQQQLSQFPFYLPDDLPTGQYLAVYQLDGQPAGSFMVSVQGIAVTPQAATEKPYYAESEPARLVITLTNNGPQATPAMQLKASFNQDRLDQPVQLDPGQQVVVNFDFTAAFGGDAKISYGLYNAVSQRAVFINTAYVRQYSPDVTVTTDKEVYLPGETVQAALVTTATGSLKVEAPGYSAVLPLPAGGFSFALPGTLGRGTYQIVYSLQGCGCPGEGLVHTYAFDVRSTQVRVTAVQLDKAAYEAGDRLRAVLTVAADQAVDLEAASWLVAPDGSTTQPITQAVSLRNSLDNLITLTHTVPAGQLGQYSLVFRLYRPAGALAARALQAAETELASGGSVFDVGAAALLSVSSDQPSYTTQADPVTALVEVLAARAVTGTLAILVDGQPAAEQAVDLAPGQQRLAVALGAGFAPGQRRLQAVLVVGAGSDLRQGEFTYATQAADLLTSAPWLEAGGAGSRVIAAMASNQGGTASGATTLRAYLGDPAAGGTLIGSAAVPALEPGAAALVTVTWNTAGLGGPNTVFAWINPDGSVPEFNTANNQASASFSLPRLALAAGADQPAYAPGEQVGLATSLENLQGARGLTLTVTTTVRLKGAGSAALFSDTRTLSLAAGESRLLGLNWDSAGQPAGPYLVEARALDELGSAYQAAGEFQLQLTDFSVTAQSLPQSPLTGQALTLTVGFANNSVTPAANPRLVVTLPDGLAYNKVLAPSALLSGPVVTGRTLTWSAGSLAAFAGGEIQLLADAEATSLAERPLAFTAAVTTTTPEANPANNRAQAGSTLYQSADLSLVVDDGVEQVKPGDALRYTLSYANPGPADALQATIVDTLVGEVSDLQCTSPAGSCQAGGSTITFTLGTVPAGGSGSAEVTLTFNAASDDSVYALLNVGSIYCQTPDRDSNNNLSTDSDQVEGSPQPTERKLYLPIVPKNRSN